MKEENLEFKVKKKKVKIKKKKNNNEYARSLVIHNLIPLIYNV